MATLDPRDLELFTFSPVDVSALARSLTLPDDEDTWYTSTRSFTIPALIHFGNEQMCDFHRQIRSWEPEGVPAVPLHHDVRVIRSEIPNLTALGRDLLGREPPDARLTSVLQGEHFNLPDFYSWVEEVYELYETDVPLLHCMVDALYQHTSPDIFKRWENLRNLLKIYEATLENLVRDAENLPRNQWHPLISEFYFLLLE